MAKKSDLKKNKAEYEKIKARSAEAAAAASTAGRDIAPIPKVRNKKRRLQGRKSLRRFCEVYFPNTFKLAWSQDHLDVIEAIELAVRDGGLFALAMPRGMGKTCLCVAACIWSSVMGFHDFVALIGADLGHATQMLDSIKSEFENNELLLADFPEVCYPIAMLGGIYQRAAGQIYKGKSTRIGWTASELRLPTIARSRASGGLIQVAGIGGRIRGMNAKKTCGTTMRPSLIILDDPQTDESARSPQQIKQRLELLSGAILNLAGPGVKMSGIMPCTVIYPDDMADRILDRTQYPSWHGHRSSLVKSFPVNEKLWEEYVEIRNNDLVAGGKGVPATEFYIKNREAMDEGCEVAWKEWYNDDEVSAIHHAMNLLYRDKDGRRMFWSEFQNKPLPPDDEIGASRFTKELLGEKLNGLPRGLVPLGAQHLTSYVDVQGEALYWVVCAWEQNFTGSIIDYGVYPPQPKDYFTLANIPVRLSSVVRANAGLDGRLLEGLNQLNKNRLMQRWKAEAGDEMAISRSMFDANWGQSTNVVYKFCREAPQGAICLPSHGMSFGASSIPMSEYRKKPGDKIGLNWRIPGRASGRKVKYALYDTNFWKSFTLARICTAAGDSGSLSMFGKNANEHELLFDHLGAEFCVETTGRGRRVDEWKVTQGGEDNHWLDCLVGCTMAASMLGSALFEKTARMARKKVKLSDLAKQKRGNLQ